MKAANQNLTINNIDADINSLKKLLYGYQLIYFMYFIELLYIFSALEKYPEIPNFLPIIMIHDLDSGCMAPQICFLCLQPIYNSKRILHFGFTSKRNYVCRYSLHRIASSKKIA